MARKPAKPKSKPAPPPTFTIRVRQTHVTGKGPIYAVTGDVSVPRTKDPYHDAARALQALDRDGNLVMYVGNSIHPSYKPMSIRTLALWSVTDETKRGLVRRKWSPRTLAPSLTP